MLFAPPRYACAAARRILSFTVSLIVLLALAGTTRAQDIAAGRVVFGKCGPCHAVGVDARNRVGPPLNGLFGRKAASLPGFAFSDALRNSGIVWDDRSFQQYIA